MAANIKTFIRNKDIQLIPTLSAVMTFSSLSLKNIPVSGEMISGARSQELHWIAQES